MLYISSIMDALSIYETWTTALKQHGISALNKLTEEELCTFLKTANSLYYNHSDKHTHNKHMIMSDVLYDILKDFIESKYPCNPCITEIGAPVTKDKVTLPYFMGSMNKIKPDTTDLTKWTRTNTGPYVLSCKLDGVSGLYSTENPHEFKLYTRGDGAVGQDISYLIPYLRLPTTPNLVIRGELIVPKATYDAKYQEMFCNPRNMITGIINQKKITPLIKEVHFVAYEIIKPLFLKPSDQMALLENENVEVVTYMKQSFITNEFLSDLLLNWRYNTPYESDGVIIVNDTTHEHAAQGNPEYAVAFKMVLSEQKTEAKVVDVIWTASKDGYLKPRVQIEPVRIGGTVITYATGFNAAFISENRIGVGAVIQLIRSGDVIPYIQSVIVPADTPKMPLESYYWNETGVDIILDDISINNDVIEKNITGFFKGIGVDGLSTGNVTRLMNAGFNSVQAIMCMTIADYLRVDGFKLKMAEKMYNGIRDKIEAASLVTLMAASNTLGRGFSSTKLQSILNEYPDVLTSNLLQTDKFNKLMAIKGLSYKSVELFLERIPLFIQFMEKANLMHKLRYSVALSALTSQINPTHPLYNKTVVMTGPRDATLQDQLLKLGVKIGSKVNKHTFAVILLDINETTAKANDARQLHIPLITPAEFTHTYLS